MHSWTDDDNGILFEFNGGMKSGELHITFEKDRYQVETKDDPVGKVFGYTTIKIPVDAILRLVAYNHVVPKRFEQLEGMDWKDILK